MMKHPKIAFSALILSLIFVSCSEYQKILGGEDYDKKFSFANELYEDGEFGKALPLYEELRRIYVGKDKVQKTLYRLANCEFQTEQYYLASYHFKQYYESYPYSDEAEDALFMHCTCLYTLSPKHTLDQGASVKAINSLERFTQRFPGSERVLECNNMIDELREKIEYKDYISAKLYYKIEDYKAAVWSLGNFLKAHPQSQFEDEIRFLLVESSFKLAELSVLKKKEERLIDTLQYFKAYKNSSNNQKRIEQASEYAEAAREELSKL